MIIRNSNSMIDFKSRFQTQNVQFKNVINSINTNARQKKPDFDVVKISLEAIQSQKTEKKDTTNLIDYKNSPINGSRTEAEWAESSLTMQRNGVNTIKDKLEYQMKELDSTLSKIDQYEKIANGDSLEINNSVISQKRAAELVDKYKDSIRTDFSEVIDNYASLYNDWVNTYDKYSNGLASKVMGNVLQDISAKSLGLSDLSGDPDEIKAALNGATEKLKDISKLIEDNFYQASGKKMMERTSSESVIGLNRLDLEHALIEMVTINKDTEFTGQILKINDSFK